MGAWGDVLATRVCGCAERGTRWWSVSPQPPASPTRGNPPLRAESPSTCQEKFVPPSRKPDQSAPRPVSPTGVDQRPAPGRGSPCPVGWIPDHRAGSAAAGHRPLAEGRRARSDAAGGLPPAGEDHPLRPRAHPGAGRARPRRGRARRLRVLRHRSVGDQGRLPGQEGHENRSLHPLLDRAGLAGFGRHRPRHPRVRGEVLHRRGHLRPGRQQHAGLLHPGRHQVPRHHPRRQAAARTARSRRRSPRTTRSGTSSRCTPRPPTT